MSCRVEPSLAGAASGNCFQFEGAEYFCVDPIDSSGKALVFNRTVTLLDSWARVSESYKKHQK